MRKVVCILGCVLMLVLVGCQMRPNPTSSNQIIEENRTGKGSTSEDNPTLLPGIKGSSLNENSLDGNVTLNEKAGEHELETKRSLHGEIEVAHKLPCGKMILAEGDIALFHLDPATGDAELKIILTGTETGMTLEDSVTGSGDISFKIDISDEYAMILENCYLRGTKFTIDYSIGGSI